MSRAGITPVVAIVLLLMMTVAAAGGTYAYLTGTIQQGQDETTDSLTTAIGVRDVQCHGSIVTVHLRNDGSTDLASTEMDLYLHAEDRLIGTHTANISDAAFRQPGGLDRVDAVLPVAMTNRQQHTVELSFPGDDLSTTATCTARNELISYWRFDEGSGTWVNDTAGTNDLRLQEVGGNICSGGTCPSWTDGVDGTALALDGSDDYGIINPAAEVPRSAATLMFWARTTGSGGAMLSYATGSSDNELLFFKSNSLDLYVGGPDYDSGVAANDGAWTHVAVTWTSSDGTARFYVNGTLQDTGTVNPGHTIGTGGALVLGQEQDSVDGGYQSGQAYNGTMDEFRLYGEAVSAERIGIVYNETRP